MYEIKAITCGSIGNNTYMIKVGGKAILVDPAEYTPIQFWLDAEGVTVEAILLTHGHFDHIAAVASLVDKYNCKVYCHAGDFPKCRGEEMGERMAQFNIIPFTPDVDIAGSDEIEICGIKITVIHTPGHSKGSVCYIVGDVILSGDTLFKDSYGRYDFYDGSLAVLKASLAKLFALEGDYVVLPGHDRSTNLRHESRHNPILWS